MSIGSVNLWLQIDAITAANPSTGLPDTPKVTVPGWFGNGQLYGNACQINGNACNMVDMEASQRSRPDVALVGSETSVSRLIHGTGEMAGLIRTYPWETSSLGSIDTWPSTLLALVNLALNSPIATAVYWGKDLIFIGNDASVALINEKPDEALATPAEALRGQHWSQIESRFRAVLDTGESFHGEDAAFFFPRPGKPDELFVNYSLSPIYHDGEIAGVFRTLHETTESVLAMRAAADSDSRLRMVLSVGKNVGVWDWHIHTNTVYGDATIASFYEIDPEAAAAGTSNLLYERMVHPDDIVLLTDAILACIMTGVDFSVDYRVRRPDGSYRWIQSRGRCIYDDNGHAHRVSGVKLDVTAQKLNESLASLPRNLFPDSAVDAPPASVTAFIAATANLLAEFPSDIKVRLVPGETETQIILQVAESDLGKLVGKGGRIIRSIRTLLYTVAAKCQRRFTIDIESLTKPWDQK